MDTVSGWLQWLVAQMSLVFKESFAWVWHKLLAIANYYLDDVVDTSYLAWPDLSPLMPYFNAANLWIPLQEAWDLGVVYVSVWLVGIASRWVLKIVGLITTGGW